MIHFTNVYALELKLSKFYIVFKKQSVLYHKDNDRICEFTGS